MTPEAAIRELQGLAHDHKAAHGYLAPYPQQWRNVEAHADTLRDIARLIESLQSERDALAFRVVQMQEALEHCKTTFGSEAKDPGDWPPLNFDEKQAVYIGSHHGYGRLMQLLSAAWYAKERGGAFAVGTCVSLARMAMRKADAALALTPTAAEAQAKANAEKAAKWDAHELRLATRPESPHPTHCPVTGRPFFMVIEGADGVDVATYGGPFDSYTIPEWDERHKEFRSERYDHDAGEWVDGGEPYPFVLIDESEYNALRAAREASDGK